MKEPWTMKQNDHNKRHELLHHLLDEGEKGPLANGSSGPGNETLSRYRSCLERLETHGERAPDDFTSRVMGALPEKPRPSWVHRLKSLWPEKRFWPIPAVTGALVMFLLMTPPNFSGPPDNRGLVPTVFDLYAPKADNVQLVGNFSDWKSGVFQLKGPDAVGYWAILVKLPPGRYEYTFLINRSELVPDDDGEVVRPDGCGSENSLLFVNGDIRKGANAAAFFGSFKTDAPSLPEENKNQWRNILQNGTKAGLREAQLGHLLSKMAASGMKPSDAQEILEPIFQDGKAGLNSRHVLLRLDEGLLKKVPVETLKKLTRQRHVALGEARSILARYGYSSTAETYPALLDATAFAIESGFSTASLNTVLEAGKDRKPRQITEVLELGETLYYAGFDPEMLLSLMERCLVKNLDVQQMERVTDHVREAIMKGENHRIIIDTLWIEAVLKLFIKRA